MVFSSPSFFAFLALVLAFLALPGTLARKKAGLAVLSAVFYAAWDYRYLALLLLVSVIDYFCANRIDETDDAQRRLRWVQASVVSNLAILAYFKYFNFFLGNLNGVLALADVKIPYRDILLPAGISFYTFKSMSYTIDVYRREIRPCASYVDYATFITFFPELIAGPIVRASVFLPQMDRAIGPSAARFASGASLFLLGLTKKRLVADHLASRVDAIFLAPEQFSTATMWAGVIGYTIQIYCDFSGYSDMAIGTAKMIGYDLPENFDTPYLSTNITEFWRRWHMTLSSWLRDYLYIPLGGNRHGVGRTYVNLFLTMLIGGLWHGASWNFVFWGALHGSALAVHKLYRRRWPTFVMPAPLAWLLTFLFVMMCWVPFRATSFAATKTILTRLWIPHTGVVWMPEALVSAVIVMVVGHLLAHWVATRDRSERSARRFEALSAAFDVRLTLDDISGWYFRLGTGTALGCFLLTCWLLAMFYFSAVESGAFIYFQF